MKYITVILCFFSLCSISQKKQQSLINAEFARIINSYIIKNGEIPNSCNAKPIYEIIFKWDNDTLGFWIHATLGGPSLVPPTEVETLMNSNKIELRGLTYFRDRPVVIFDFEHSDGYKLYDTESLIDHQTIKFEDIGTCGHESYPEGYYYRVTQDSIYFVKKRAGFHLQ